MLLRSLRRFSTKRVSSPLQRIAKEKTTPSPHASSENPRDNDSASTSPWNHFEAFTSMDNYVDVTLIQYNQDQTQHKNR
ncbi:hypothetical protein PsorP6_007214 [Peronosclerospora sorghi]|uniref:Uncharacterized protein n=1 Tax=Peronosclerospora sorghi TaxID=230839 RepID=A0ACC0W8Z3_9STRA|nr:hypothetical protein PsorP6_007214 [Peronosclerospora sorghi]